MSSLSKLIVGSLLAASHLTNAASALQQNDVQRDAGDDFYTADDFYTSGDSTCQGGGLGSNGICANVLGQSGKITFSYKNMKDITVEMDSITEVDAQGDAVGTTGSVKHSFNSFASQDFVFGDIYDTTFQGLSASAVNFTASLVDDNVNFGVRIITFHEAGNITYHNERYEVFEGTFKFSYSFDTWPFCTAGGSGITACTKGRTEQVGEFLDFAITIKGLDANDDSGAGTSVANPNAYFGTLPGQWFEMPTGYPLEEVQGSQTQVTFRFARFDTGGIDYDPTIDWGEDLRAATEGPTEPPTVAPVTSAPTGAPVVASSDAPTGAPVVASSDAPTGAPVVASSDAPTGAPVVASSDAPTGAPVVASSDAPSDLPTVAPVTTNDDDDELDMCVGGICADVLGQSGKITFSTSTESITIEMDSITEVDAQGDAVGTSGSVKHSFNSFASQDFAFGDIYDTTFQGLSASAVNFTASLVDDNVNFTVVIYLFLETGNVTNYDETYEVSAGSFKFSYLFSSWPFCTIGGSGVTECTKGQTEQEGAYLDFTIVMKGNDAADSNNGTVLINPNVYFAESIGWATMPEGYPLEEVQGANTYITFRFDRFNASLDYDPFINWGEDITDDVLHDDDDNNNNSGAVTFHLSSSGILLLAILATGMLL